MSAFGSLTISPERVNIVDTCQCSKFNLVLNMLLEKQFDILVVWSVFHLTKELHLTINKTFIQQRGEKLSSLRSNFALVDKIPAHHGLRL